MRGLLLIAALLACACAPPAENYRALKQERVEAYRTRDRAFFERLLTDDFVAMDATGAHTRAEYLDANFAEASAAAPTVNTEVSNFNASRTGDTLVLTYEEMERATVGAEEFTEHLRRLDVYVRQEGRWRLRAMTAVKIPQAPPAIALTPAQLAPFVGSYTFAPGVVSRVWLDGVRLKEQTTGQPETTLVPIGPATFYAPPDAEARVAFERGARGRVIAQTYRSGTQTFRGTRN